MRKPSAFGTWSGTGLSQADHRLELHMACLVLATLAHATSASKGIRMSSTAAATRPAPPWGVLTSDPSMHSQRLLRQRLDHGSACKSTLASCTRW